MCASHRHHSAPEVKEPVPSTDPGQSPDERRLDGTDRTERHAGRGRKGTVAAEIQPAKSTFTAPEVVLYGCVVLLYGGLVSAVGMEAALDGSAWMKGIGGLLIIAGLPAFRLAYVSTHRKVETTARHADGELVVCDPNPWWRQFTLTGRRGLRLEVDTLEEQDGTRVARGRTTGVLGLTQEYRVWLEAPPETREEGAPG